MKRTKNLNNKQFLSVSVVMATFNSSRTITQSLQSIRDQHYPQEKIEIIAADGGSTDNTRTIVKRFGGKVIKVPKEKQNAEYNKGIGVRAAKNEIILLLDHDNILPHPDWLAKMIVPFIKHKEIVGTEALRFYYGENLNLLDRYFALLGGNDPVAYYLNKDSHLSWAFDQYNLYGKAKDMGDYYLVNFTANKIPAIGGNGALWRRTLVLKEAQADPDHFFHIDIHVDMIRKGFRSYALVKDSIIHLTNNKLLPFLQRRKYFIEKYHFEDMSKRRYSVYEPQKDKQNLIKYVIYSLTVVKPLYDALRGFSKVPDMAWFLHPVMCIAMVIVYGSPAVKGGIRQIFGK